MAKDVDLQKEHNRGQEDRSKSSDRTGFGTVLGDSIFGDPNYRPDSGKGQDSVDSYNKGWKNNH